MLKKHMRHFLAAVGLFLLAFSTQAQNYSVVILSPAPAEVIEGSTVKVELQTPTDFITGENGYIYLWLDPILQQTSENAKIISEGAAYTFERVPGGLHTLWVELVQPDRTSFDPKVEASVEFETIGNELTGSDGGLSPGQPLANGSLFLPRGRANSIGVIVLIAALILGLWYFFGRPAKEKS